MKPTITQMRVALQIALLGEIYSAIRAIAFDYNLEKKRFTLRYYLDREPTENDFENISDVITEFISCFSYSEFEDLKQECEYSDLPQSQLEPLLGFVYSRKENLHAIRSLT